MITIIIGNYNNSNNNVKLKTESLCKLKSM